MSRFRKRHLSVALAASLGLAVVPWPGPGASVRAHEEDVAARLDALFVELAEPGREDWPRIEREIIRLWSRSGSDAMDMLLRRGQASLAAEDFPAAVEHLTALTDHAPGFAEGWNARATAFFAMGEFALSISDIERVLALNPRHFGALSGLAIMLEQIGEVGYARDALRAVRTLNPNRPNVDAALERLNALSGEAEL